MIQIWSDRLLRGATDWDKEIHSRLENADIILLLLSSDYFASSTSYSYKEMEQALERAKTGKAKVIPIILRPVDWKASPLGTLPALPTGAKPVTTWANNDAVWADVARGVREAVQSLRKTPKTGNKRG
jgi:internalin A